MLILYMLIDVDTLKNMLIILTYSNHPTLTLGPSGTIWDHLGPSGILNDKLFLQRSGPASSRYAGPSGHPTGARLFRHKLTPQEEVRETAETGVSHGSWADFMAELSSWLMLAIACHSYPSVSFFPS
jgi:hypothetical protein